VPGNTAKAGHRVVEFFFTCYLCVRFFLNYSTHVEQKL